MQIENTDSFKQTNIELIFIAIDNYNEFDLINEVELLNKYMIEDENGFYNMESLFIDCNENIGKLIEFLFLAKFHLSEIHLSETVSIYDLSSLISKNIDLKQLENDYLKWIAISDRNNTMDEYGMLLGLISLFERSSTKKHLILRVGENNL